MKTKELNVNDYLTVEDRVMIHGVNMDKLKDFVTRTIPAKVLKERTTKKKA